MTDKELEKIYNEAYKAVYWTAMSLLKNEADAEDIVQDTFVTLIESYDTIQDKSKVIPWLKKIAANKCLNRLTRTKTDAAPDEFFEDVEALPEDFLPDSIVESEETRKIIMDIINNSLSEDVRRTLILFYFDEMSTKEIAEAMGIPQGTVLWRLSFAKKKIKKEVEKYEDENNTKLYGMAVPFLSKLFMKEAEQVIFKPMPASLTTLSASGEASTSGAGTKMAAEAVKKGTGIMMKKGLIIGIAATVVVVGAVAGITIGVLSKKEDKNPSKKDKTKIEQTEDDIRATDDSVWADPVDDTTEETEETDETRPSKKVTENSIFVVMKDMTAEECIENIWKTANVRVGMTKAEYDENLIVPDDMWYFKTLDDSFYWQANYSEECKGYITQLSVGVAKDKDPLAIKELNKMSCVELMVNCKDEAFAKELFEAAIEKYKAEGYVVKFDQDGVMSGSRVMEFEGHGRSFRISYIPMQGFTMDFKIPILTE